MDQNRWGSIRSDWDVLACGGGDKDGEPFNIGSKVDEPPEFFSEGWGYFILAPTALLASILMVDHVVRQYFWRYVIVNYGWQYQDSDWFFLVTGVIAFALIIATVFSFLGAARLLKWVNDHTANGTVGILGFVK